MIAANHNFKSSSLTLLFVDIKDHCSMRKTNGIWVLIWPKATTYTLSAKKLFRDNKSTVDMTVSSCRALLQGCSFEKVLFFNCWGGGELKSWESEATLFNKRTWRGIIYTISWNQWKKFFNCRTWCAFLPSYKIDSSNLNTITISLEMHRDTTWKQIFPLWIHRFLRQSHYIFSLFSPPSVSMAAAEWHTWEIGGEKTFWEMKVGKQQSVVYHYYWLAMFIIYCLQE